MCLGNISLASSFPYAYLLQVSRVSELGEPSRGQRAPGCPPAVEDHHVKALLRGVMAQRPQVGAAACPAPGDQEEHGGRGGETAQSSAAGPPAPPRGLQQPGPQGPIQSHHAAVPEQQVVSGEL